jgi:uncharacterized protein YkwD
MLRTTNRNPRRRALTITVASTLAIALLFSLGATTAMASRGLRSQMLALTNQSRRAHNERALHLDRKLSRSAKKHSLKMARRGEPYHSSNVTRYLHGRHWRYWGENVGESWETDLSPLQRAFMRSRDHRYNVLNGAYERVGIGAVHRDGRVWVTLVFYG